MRRSTVAIGALLLLSLSCRRPREEPPAHLARLREWRSSAPAFWNVEENGLIPWTSAADAEVSGP